MFGDPEEKIVLEDLRRQVYGARIMGKLRFFAPMAFRRGLKSFQKQKKFGRRSWRVGA